MLVDLFPGSLVVDAVPADVHGDVLAHLVRASLRRPLPRPIAVVELRPTVAIQELPHRLDLRVLAVDDAAEEVDHGALDERCRIGVGVLTARGTGEVGLGALVVPILH